MSDGVEVEALRTVAGWLAGLPAFHAFAGVSGFEAAQARVIAIDGAVQTEPHAVIGLPVVRFARTPGGSHDGTADVTVRFLAPLVEGDAEGAGHERNLRHLSAIRRELLCAGGQAILDMEAETPVQLDKSDSEPAGFTWSLMLSIEVTP